MKISLFALWIFLAALAGCKEDPRTKQMESIDWQSLEFRCTWKTKPGPPRNDEAEHWYQTANRLYKSGMDKQLVEAKMHAKSVQIDETYQDPPVPDF